MKKVFLLLVLFMTMALNAQTNLENAKLATSKGNYVIGLNTTNLGFSNVQNSGTTINVGLNVGYFVDARTAIVVGGGYDAFLSSGPNSNSWTYTAGVKQYIGSVVPVQVDWNGATGNNIYPNKSAIGLQAGYGFFPTKTFSIEPAVRYNISLTDSYEDVLSGALGFHYFF